MDRGGLRGVRERVRERACDTRGDPFVQEIVL